MFISYAREDNKEALRLYEQLKTAGLKPWLDKENIIAGKDWTVAIKAAIKKSRFFIPLFSSTSVAKRGYIQEEFRYAVDYAKRFPPDDIFIIPIKLDECKIPYEELSKIHHIEMFPDWNEGFKKILQSIQFDNQALVEHKKTRGNQVLLEIDDDISPNMISTAKGGEQLQKKGIVFTGEKTVFVGRGDYIEKRIKEGIITPGSRVSIVGPGGSGKSQLAFKAIHQYYEKENIFDIVIPIYFDAGLMTFSQFISRMAEKLMISSMKISDFEKKERIEERKEVIRNTLTEKTHPLIFADNFETISYPINAANTNYQKQQPPEDAIKIKYFLNNEIPENTSVLITSRERVNLGGPEKTVDLEGLDENESMELFSTLVVEQYLKNPSSVRVKQKIDKLLKKTGGHPLSVEIMAKNITSIEELDEMSKSLGDRINVDEPNARQQSLKASFDYTLSKLNNNLKDLLQKLTFFKSPFPLYAAEEIFDAKKRDIINLYNRSLLSRIESDDIYGKMNEPDYFLYTFHPAIRDHLENEISQKIEAGKFYDNLETMYGQRFVNVYFGLLNDTFRAIENRDTDLSDKIIRFNVIVKGENNDFERSVGLTNEPYLRTEVLTFLGSILNRLGVYNKALEYHKRSEKINEVTNDNDSKVRLGRDYQNIGWLFSNLRVFDRALEYHEKALSEYTRLNSHAGIARENSYIGLTLSKLKRHEEALEYHKKAIAMDENIDNNERWLAEDYHNIASTFYNMGNYDKALEYYKLALEMHTELGDTLRMSYCHSGLGLTYEALSQYPQALDHHDKALELRKKMKDNVGIARQYYNISFVFSKMYKKKKALEYLSDSKSMLEKFERQTGYRHPILDQVQERISYLRSIK